MINLKIGKQKAYLPEPKTVLLVKFIEWLEFMDEHEPAWWEDLDLDKEGGALDQLDSKQKLELYDFAAKELAFWSNLSHEQWRKADLNELFGVWSWYRAQFNYEYAEEWNCLEIDGKIYYLPERYMSESTLEDYAESNEYENQLSEVLNGHYIALFNIASVLLRQKKDGRLETYDEYNIDHRAANFKDHLTALQAHQIAFFLQRQSNKLQKDSQIYMTAQTLAALKQDMSS